MSDSDSSNRVDRRSRTPVNRRRRSYSPGEDRHRRHASRDRRRSRSRSRSSSRRSSRRSSSSRDRSRSHSRSRSRSRRRRRRFQRDRSRSADEVPQPEGEEEEMEEGEVPRSPGFDNYVIPKKSDFAAAVGAVPAPPKLSKKEVRSRVEVDEDAKKRFQTWAGGTFIPTTDRKKILKDLPLITSTLALPPVLDEELKGQIKKNIDLVMTEAEFDSIYDGLLTALNVLELVRKLGSDDKGAPFGEDVTGYFNVLGEILSASLKDALVAKRCQTLKALGVAPQQAMSGYKKLGLDADSFVGGERDEEIRPALFGKALLEQLGAEDSATRKALAKLRKPATSFQTPPKYRRPPPPKARASYTPRSSDSGRDARSQNSSSRGGRGGHSRGRGRGGQARGTGR